MEEQNKIYDEVPRIDLKHSNRGITQLIKGGKKFLICKMGEDSGGLAVSNYFGELPTEIALHEIVSYLTNKSGIYSTNEHDYKDYAKLYFQILEQSTAIAYYPPNISQLRSFTEVNFFNTHQPIPPLNHECLEPYYAIMDGMIPWSRALADKKVLIVHPFVESFKKQREKNFEIYPNNPVFSREQHFVYYKAYNTAGGNHLHKNWKETFGMMCNDISKLDFDIALIGCGGYSVPLAGHIYDNLNKSAICIGGGLQLLFGVMGKRWENTEMWQSIQKEYKCEFIKPSDSETIPNKELVMGGAYW